MQGRKCDASAEDVRKLASQFSDTLAAREIGVSVSTFYLLRKRYGIPSFTEASGMRRARSSGALLAPGEGVAHPSSSSLRVDCFDSVDDPGKAYFLGLFATDGSLEQTSKNKFAQVEMQMPDALVLKELGAMLQSSTDLRVYRRPGKKPVGRLRIYSAKLVDSLIRAGICLDNKKSTVPSGLSREMRPYCLRGILDGDGHICSSKKMLELTGCSSPLMDTVSSWVGDELGIRAKISNRVLPSGIPYYRLTFGGRPRDVLRWVYGPHGPVVARKKAESDLWLSMVE